MILSTTQTIEFVPGGTQATYRKRYSEYHFPRGQPRRPCKLQTIDDQISIYPLVEASLCLFTFPYPSTVPILLPFGPYLLCPVFPRNNPPNGVYSNGRRNESALECSTLQRIDDLFADIFAVISYDRAEDAFRLSLFSEESVPLFGPTLPCPPLFHNHQEFREFLLVKRKLIGPLLNDE